MKSPFESMQAESVDPLLEKLAESVKPVAELIDGEEHHSLLVFGTKYLEDQGVQTYTIATGYFGILAEGMYAELADQLENGNPALFAVFRQVIRDLEEDFDISDDDDILKSERPTLN